MGTRMTWDWPRRTGICHLLVGVAGWGIFAVNGWAQQGGAEKSVPRISLKPGNPADDKGVADETQVELLPPLPETGQDEAPRRTPPRTGAIPLPPDIPPLGLPSDGEAAPSFPDLPDLPDSSLPHRPAAGEADVPSGADPNLLPGENLDPLLPSGVRRPDSDPAGGLVPAPAVAGDPLFPVWHESPRKARDLAQNERRCLLLVFSNSIGEAGGASRQLNDEMFASRSFNEFALNHLVICGLFFTKHSNLDMEDPTKIARMDAMADFKKAFKVRGFPCVILCDHNGKELRRWTGFNSGRGLQYEQQIRQAVEGHEAVLFAAERRRQMLAAKGFRTWTSAHGTPLFARLLEYDAHSALFRDEAGAERKVSLKQLSLPDRELITRKRLGKPLPQVDAEKGSTTLR